jgi:hypothetical protein
LAQQVNNYPDGVCWDHYFPYKPFIAGKYEPSFIQFLRFSFYRPRDIVTLLELLKEVNTRNGSSNPNFFSQQDFDNSELQTRYSDYLMGEIKDYLSFYYKDHDYELFRKFFDFLEGRREFDYALFNQAFKSFEDYLSKNNILRPKFFETADTFLQFIYELNIICFIEAAGTDKYIRWCFRERNYSNISPKVKANSTYQIHYGLIKNLNLGKRINPRKKKN